VFGRGEISARRHPRFIRRLALSFSGRDFSAAAPPVHSAIGFITERGEIAARRQPRFIRRLALSFSGRDFSAAAPPVHSAIGFITERGEIAARRQPRFIRRLTLSFSGKARFQRGRTTPVRQASAFSFLFFYSFEAKRKKRTSTKPIWRAGPREAITCVQINHEVEQRTTPPPTPCCLL
jgi:hypothetical protein